MIYTAVAAMYIRRGSRQRTPCWSRLRYVGGAVEATGMLCAFDGWIEYIRTDLVGDQLNVFRRETGAGEAPRSTCWFKVFCGGDDLRQPPERRHTER